MAFDQLGSGSYPEKDVTFLLKDISHLNLEGNIEEREKRIQEGKEHYSDSLPREELPTEDYIENYRNTLGLFAEQTAEYVGSISYQLHDRFKEDMVLVSLARAGTPVGILVKRYLQDILNCEVSHYSLSIIRGKGIDQSALHHIKTTYPNKSIVFVDGWTGKGSITKELIASCHTYSEMTGYNVDPFLAVISDPAYCATVSATHEDIMIPHACLNATISGLVSRTAYNERWIGPGEYHGAKFYKEWHDFDLSNDYIDNLTSLFRLKNYPRYHRKEPQWVGVKQVEQLQREFSISNPNFIKTSIGETTRILLRRVPWKVIVKDRKNSHVQHILFLAQKKGVEVVEDPSLLFNCCGIIRQIGEST